MNGTSSDRLTQKVSLLSLTVWSAAVGTRLLIAPLEERLTIIALACLGALFVVHIAIVYFNYIRIGGFLILSLLTVSLLFLASYAGGINGPLVILFPLVPLLAALLLGKVPAWCACVLIVLVSISFYLGGLSSIDYYENFPEDELRGRLTTFWVVFGTLATTAFATFFHQENQILNKALIEKALVDYLTELPNKRAIEERLRRESAVAKRTGGWMSVIMLDIDFFKQYNDRNGHAKGDECLTLIAQTLRDTLKREGDFIGRYGGEEFIALLPDTNPEAAKYVAESMRTAIAGLYKTNSLILEKPITITLGSFSTTGNHILNMDDLVSRADQALYKGKKAGRNCIVSEVDPKAGTPISVAVTEEFNKQQRRSTDIKSKAS